jgi:hypothetical protein
MYYFIYYFTHRHIIHSNSSLYHLYFLQKDVRRRHVDQLNKQHESKISKLIQDKDKQIKVCASSCRC